MHTTGTTALHSIWMIAFPFITVHLLAQADLKMNQRDVKWQMASVRKGFSNLNEMLLKQLNDYRTLFVELEKLHIANPIFWGWLTLNGRSNIGVDFHAMIRACVDQLADPTISLSLETGLNVTFPYTGLNRPKIEEYDLRRQAENLSKLQSEVSNICEYLPVPVQTVLRMPIRCLWPQKLFHLAWHFPHQTLLCAPRFRLFKSHKNQLMKVGERIIQQSKTNLKDAFPGALFSLLEADIYRSSITAIDVITEMLDKLQKEPPQHNIAFEEYTALHRSFTSPKSGLNDLNFQILKFTNSFFSKPASKWAKYNPAAPNQHSFLLSALGSDWEEATFHGPCADDLSQLCQQAGNLLPSSIPVAPIMFSKSDEKSLIPVFNRNTQARWIGHVLTTLKKHQPELIETVWCSPDDRPYNLYGYSRLKINFCEASALCIELSGFLGKKGKGKQPSQVKPEKKKRGRHVVHDPKEDMRIYESWKSGEYRSKAGLADELRILPGEVVHAIDRHRQRLSKAKLNCSD